MTSTELTAYEASDLEERRRYAETLATAGDLIPKGLHYQPRNPQTNAAAGPPIPSPGKVLLVMETGAMLGLHPIAALQGIHVIEGKASMSSATMAAVVRKAGHDLRVWTTGSVKDDTFEAHARLIRGDDPERFEYTSTWDADRATRAKLIAKDNWQNYFEAMCKNRVISDVCRDGASDALAGVIYTPDELGAAVNERDEVIVGTVIDDTPTEPAAPSAMPKPSKRPATGTQGTKRATAPAAAADAPETPQEPVADLVDAVDAAIVDAGDGAGPQSDPSDEELKAQVAAKRAARQKANAPHEGAVASKGDEPDPADMMTDAELAAEAEADLNIEDAVVVEDDGPAAVLEPDPEPGNGYGPPSADAPYGVDPAGDALAQDDWIGRLAAHVTVEHLRLLWNDALAAGQLTTDLKKLVGDAKAKLES